MLVAPGIPLDAKESCGDDSMSPGNLSTARYARTNGVRASIRAGLARQTRNDCMRVRYDASRMKPFLSLLALSALVCGMAARPEEKAPPASRDWPVWGGGPENTHYSPLTQIHRGNVKGLEVAWTFDTEEQGGLQTRPIIVDGVLYGITPTQKIFALDAANGKLLWKFDSGIKGTQPERGLAYWSSGADKRILVGVMNFVYALDAATGKPIPAFGKDGRIDLRDGLGRNPELQSVALTSPASVY